VRRVRVRNLQPALLDRLAGERDPLHHRTERLFVELAGPDQEVAHDDAPLRGRQQADAVHDRLPEPGGLLGVEDGDAIGLRHHGDLLEQLTDLVVALQRPGEGDRKGRGLLRALLAHVVERGGEALHGHRARRQLAFDRRLIAGGERVHPHGGRRCRCAGAGRAGGDVESGVESILWCRHDWLLTAAA
jgi:hypothetical protein